MSDTHKYTELVHSSLGRQNFEAAEKIILLLLYYLKHRPISHLQIASRVVADFDSCHCVCQHLPGQWDKSAVVTCRSLIPHYSQIRMQTKLWD